MFPLNQSVTRDGAVKGYYVKEADRLWPAAFPARTSELIEDPEEPFLWESRPVESDTGSP